MIWSTENCLWQLHKNGLLRRIKLETEKKWDERESRSNYYRFIQILEIKSIRYTCISGFFTYDHFSCNVNDELTFQNLWGIQYAGSKFMWNWLGKLFPIKFYFSPQIKQGSQIRWGEWNRRWSNWNRHARTGRW